MPGNKKPSRKKKKNNQKRNSFHNRKNVDTISSKVVLPNKPGVSVGNYSGRRVVASPEVIASLTRRFPISEEIAREMIESGYLDPTGTMVNPAMLSNTGGLVPVFDEYDDTEYSLAEDDDWDDEVFKSYYDSPIGRMWLLAEDDLIVGSWFEDQKDFIVGCESLQSIEQSDDELCFVQTREWLDQYFAGKNPDPVDLPLDKDTAFCENDIHMVAADLIEIIPYGSVRTYSDIARDMTDMLQGKGRMHPRTLAAEVNNHIGLAVLVPTHRAVGSNGRLGGYAGGVERKKFLLQLEGVDVSKFH